MTGKEFRAARERLELNIGQMAKRLGFTRQYIWMLENDRQEISRTTELAIRYFELRRVLNRQRVLINAPTQKEEYPR